MQTICAHCYTRLSYRQQCTACILCTKCEQHWAAGKPRSQDYKLPEWPGNIGLVFKQDSHAPA